MRIREARKGAQVEEEGLLRGGDREKLCNEYKVLKFKDMVVCYSHGMILCF